MTHARLPLSNVIKIRQAVMLPEIMITQGVRSQKP
jgi:hypothetical protein